MGISPRQREVTRNQQKKSQRTPWLRKRKNKKRGTIEIFQHEISFRKKKKRNTPISEIKEFRHNNKKKKKKKKKKRKPCSEKG